MSDNRDEGIQEEVIIKALYEKPLSLKDDLYEFFLPYLNEIDGNLFTVYDDGFYFDLDDIESLEFLTPNPLSIDFPKLNHTQSFHSLLYIGFPYLYPCLKSGAKSHVPFLACLIY